MHPSHCTVRPASTARLSHHLIHPGPRHGETVDHRNWRGEVGGDGLDVDEKLATLQLLNDGDPADGEGDQQQDEQPGGMYV